jgi:hypothetical protein
LQPPEKKPKKEEPKVTHALLPPLPHLPSTLTSTGTKGSAGLHPSFFPSRKCAAGLRLATFRLTSFLFLSQKPPAKAPAKKPAAVPKPAAKPAVNQNPNPVAVVRVFVFLRMTPSDLMLCAAGCCAKARRQACCSPGNQSRRKGAFFFFGIFE